MTHILPRARALLSDVQNNRAERNLQTRVATALVLEIEAEEVLGQLIHCLHHLTRTQERQLARDEVYAALKRVRNECWALNDAYAKAVGGTELALKQAPVTLAVNGLLSATERLEKLLKLPEGC